MQWQSESKTEQTVAIGILNEERSKYDAMSVNGHQHTPQISGASETFTRNISNFNWTGLLIVSCFRFQYELEHNY